LGESGRRDGLRAAKGLQNFAEAEASGNAVGQKDGSLSFCLIVRMGLCAKAFLLSRRLGTLRPQSASPLVAIERD